MEQKMETIKIAIVVMAIVVLTALPVSAGSLEPSAPPAPTMKTLDEVEPRTPIHKADLPLTITKSGSYYLVEDSNCVSTAITINADDVTIDLMGYTLTGPDSGANYGIRMVSRNNVEIRNGTIRDFYSGIYEGGGSSHNHRIIDVRAVSNTKSGIFISGNNHLVKNCTASDNGAFAAGVNAVHGIYINNGSMVTGNTVYNNGDTATDATIYGIYTTAGSTVTGNTVYNNGDTATGATIYGIYNNGGSTVTGNTVYNNGWNTTGATVYGIHAGNGCTVTGNSAYYNGYNASTAYGIYLVGNSLVDQNTAYVNGSGAGSATNITLGVTGCVYGLNVAP